MKALCRLFIFVNIILFTQVLAPSSRGQSAYGFRIGANVATLEGEFAEGQESESFTGLVAGSYVQYDLRANFGLQIEVLYSSKGVILPSFQTLDSESELQVVYIETPLLLTYDVDFATSVVPSLHLGPAFAFEISERLFDRIEGFEQSQASSVLRSPDIGIAFGLDVRFNLLSLDGLAGIRYTHGLRNLALSETNDDAEARARTLTFTIGFLL